MSRKSTTPKGKTNPSSWFTCDQCHCFISAKDSEHHLNDCPPNTECPKHNFISNETIYSKLETKSTDPIKGLTDTQKDHLIFLSQSAMKLCNMAIGDSVLVYVFNSGNEFVANVWPTSEKSVTSILLTKNSIDRNGLDNNTILSVRKHEINMQAKKIYLTIETETKNMEVTHQLQERLNKHYIGCSVAQGNILSLLYFGKQLKLKVRSIIGEFLYDDIGNQMCNLSLESNSNKFYQITEKTQLMIYKDEEQFIKVKIPKHQLSSLGGLQNEIEELKSLINAALQQRQRTLIKPCKGVLLYGQSGTGKTHLAKAIAASLERVNVIEINSTDLYSKYAGNVEENLRKLFGDVKNTAPCLIVMDEVEILCPSRTSRITESEKRVVSCVLNELDALLNEENLQVFVLGTTNKIENLDSAFRRSGRFDREIEIPVPNPNGRLQILKILLGDGYDDEILKAVAYDTHGFVGADLISLCSTAALHGKPNLSDFKHALTKIRPSAMREVQIEVPNVKWSDIGGQEKLKLILKQCVEWPLKHAESFTRLGIQPPRGVLMYGPPGCSKTMIAKALASESGLNFLSIKGPELFSKWVGESEKAIREVFRKARQVAPSIIFFDEIDALGGERASGSGNSSSVQERVLAQLLTELDGVVSLGDVTILAATNRPDRIDNALLRPGRLDRIVYVPLPDDATRREIFKIKLGKMPVKGIEIDALVAKTCGYSGAEVNAICHEAAMMALEEDLKASHVEERHFVNALALITPRTPPSLVKMYEEYHKK